MKLSTGSTPEYHRARRQEIAAKKAPIHCRCGCGVRVFYPNRYTEQCKEAAKAKIYADHLERMKVERAAKPAPKPRKKFKPIMTDAQQEQINREVAETSSVAMAQVNQTMLMQRMMRGAIVESFDTRYPVRSQVEYQPPQRVSPYTTSQSSSWD